MTENVSIVWFRHDLRLADNPALQAALERGGVVVPVFVWAPDEEGHWAPGGASRWWLHHSLASLAEQLTAAGSRLLIGQGPSLVTLTGLARRTKARAVFWNRRYEPRLVQRDRRIEEALNQQGLVVGTFNGSLLREPWETKNKSGRPFQVFTPFWRTCLETEPSAPRPRPTRIPGPAKWPASEPLGSLGLEPTVDWAKTMREVWRPGEATATERLGQFSEQSFPMYSDRRNRPDQDGTSRLSPHLHFGEISPRQVWHAIRQAAASAEAPDAWRRSQFLAELGWREFGYHLLHHFPRSSESPLREQFQAFPWRENAAWLEAWQRGRTGYPIVDAGMRQLWATGWMHNRVRMVVASFLVKDLLISWTSGARWFWDTLVDADLASNTLGWQWTAGCGADAAPYFRVFNPVAQGEKFDPDGAYVKRWVPELAQVPARYVHRLWEAPPDVLRVAAVKLGETYPDRLVQHHIAREVALEAYKRIKAS